MNSGKCRFCGGNHTGPCAKLGRMQVRRIADDVVAGAGARGIMVSPVLRAPRHRSRRQYMIKYKREWRKRKKAAALAAAAKNAEE